MSSEASLAPSPSAAPAADGHNNDLPFTSQLSQLVATADRFLNPDTAPRFSNFQFQIHDLPFYARHDRNNPTPQLQIWSALGYMPFSAESPERRQQLTEIICATQNLSYAKFGVTDKQQIIVTTSCALAKIQPPAFIFPALIPFYEEALPYIQLIGEYL